MNNHLSEEQVKLYSRKRLKPSELVRVDEHLSICSECRTALDGNFLEIIESFQQEFSSGQEQHLTYEQLVEVVDNKFPIGSGLVRAHLETCVLCKAEYDDLLAFATQNEQPIKQKFYPWLALAAALIAIALVAGLRFFRTSEQPAQQTQRIERSIPVVVSIQDAGTTLVIDQQGKLSGLNAPSQYRDAVRLALLKGQMQIASPLDSVITQRGIIRGDKIAGLPFALRKPVGTIVSDDRPVFEWESYGGATKYRVTVLDLNMKIAADSGWIMMNKWSTEMPLQRDTIYVWQVAALRNGREVVSPSPPAGEARFRILDQATFRELQNSREKYSDSYLLLALLYAQHGLLDEAEQNLQKVIQLNAGSTELKRLLENVQNRRSGEGSPTTINPAQ